MLMLLLGALRPASGSEKQLLSAKRDYAEASAKNEEQARVRYVSRLTGMLAGLVKADPAASQREGEAGVVMEELARHPAPASFDGAKLTRRRMGYWASPRQEYVYWDDGSWTMLPEKAGAPEGLWRLAGNRFITTNWAEPRRTLRYTIIHLDDRYFTYMDGDGSVFFEVRMKRKPKERDAREEPGKQ